jgi:hypothetical protein
MIRIEGKVYEAKKIITLFDREVIRKKEEFKFIGEQAITVKYVLFMPEVELSTIFHIFDNAETQNMVYRLAFLAIADKEHWKKPTEGAFKCQGERIAVFLLNALVYFTGGAWLIEGKDGYWYVWSKGYFHYIGP